MGNKFKVVWDDFTGGYFVGENDAKQPRNTWTGSNVNLTTHDGSLVATNQIKQMALYSALPSLVADNSIYLNASASNAQIYIVDVKQVANTIIVLQYERFSGGSPSSRFRILAIQFQDYPDQSPPSTQVVSASSWVTGTTAQLPSNIATDGTYVYISYGNTLYRFLPYGPFSSTTATIPGAASNFELYIWNSRMIAVSKGTATFYFSDALDFMTWPTLNYITVGNTNTEIKAIGPRYDDMLILKTDATYSLSGVLSINASIRQVYDGIFFPADSVGTYTISDPGVASRRNTLFYLDASNHPMYTNINYLYGQQKGVTAYYNFGYSIGYYLNNPYLSTSYDDKLFCTFPRDFTGQAGFSSLIKKSDNKWVKVDSPTLTFYEPDTSKTNKYMFKYLALSNPSRPLNLFGMAADPIFFVQIGMRQEEGSIVGTTLVNKRIVISFATFYLNQVNAGTDYDGWRGNNTTANWSEYALPTSGTVNLSKIETENLSKVTDVYVEAVLDLDFTNYGEMAGDATMSVTTTNLAVDDLEYSTSSFTSAAKQYSTDLEDFGTPALYPPRYQWPISVVSSIASFTPTPPARLNTTRIIRFRVDDGGYGYAHQVSITFSGYRIKRVWVEGTDR